LAAKLHPYVVFLPTDQKERTLSAIFGSKAAVDLLRFSLKQDVSKNIYQKDVCSKLNYSNKTILENLKALTKLGVLNEEMEKNEREGRIIWVKTYQLTDAGKWFALLLAEEKELTEQEKAEILQSLFRTYVKMVKGLAEEIGINKKALEDIFRQEMK
jgi:DNA-binding PadR family transcriptional regulator